MDNSLSNYSLFVTIHSPSSPCCELCLQQTHYLALFNFFYLTMCIHVCLCEGINLWVGAHGDQKRVLDPLELRGKMMRFGELCLRDGDDPWGKDRQQIWGGGRPCKLELWVVVSTSPDLDARNQTCVHGKSSILNHWTIPPALLSMFSHRCCNTECLQE